ncbi:MAG: ferric reductase-like transmembrane domain-containing protein [Actinomycetes bacterium]
MLDPRTYWWISRSTGIIAWAVLSLSVIWGLALTTRLLGKFPKPAWMLDLHKHFASLASILVGVHVVSLMLDGYARFSLSDILIPMHTQWKPGPIAWGVVSLYVLIAVQGTSLAKRHLPLKVWRMLHFLSYPLWALATAHFITAGTDAYEPVFAYTVIGTTILISALTLGRLLSPRAARVPSAASSAAAAAAAAAASSAAPASAAASETAGAKKPSAERVPRVKAAGNAAPGSRAEMIAKARAQAAAAKSDSGGSPSEETPTPLPEAPAPAAAAAAAPAPAAPAAPPMEAAPAPQRAVAPQPEPAAAQPVVTAPVREDLVARARAAAAAANAGKSAPKPSAANSTNDAITRAREAALIELARRSADKGSSSSQQPEAAASEVIDLSTGSQEQISPSE